MVISTGKCHLQYHTRELHSLWRSGSSVEGIMNEMRMKRGAVLRALQRACRRDPRFPKRDHFTDRPAEA